MVQWLTFCAFSAVGPGSSLIGEEVIQAALHGKKKEKNRSTYMYGGVPSLLT